MHTAVHNFVAKSLVCPLGTLIIDDGIGSHLDTPMTAGPLLSLGYQQLANPTLTVIFRYIPAFDVAHRL